MTNKTKSTPKNKHELSKKEEAALKAAKGVLCVGKTLYMQFKLPDKPTAVKKSLGITVTLSNIKLAEMTRRNIDTDIINGTYKNDPDTFWQRHFPLDTSHLKSGIGIEKLFDEYRTDKINYLSDSRKDKLTTGLNWMLHNKTGVRDIASITSEKLEKIRQASVQGTIKYLREKRYHCFLEQLKRDFGSQALKVMPQKEIDKLEKEYNARHVIKFAGCKVSTVNEYTKTIKQVLDHAVKKGYLKSNPAENLERLAKDNIKQTKQNRDVNPFSAEEFEQLLEVVHVPRTKRMIKFLAWTGLRHGELKALAWEDVHLDADDPDKSTIHVKYNLTRKGNLKMVKTDAGVRTIQLLPAAIEVLKELKEISYGLPPIEEEIHGNNQKSEKVKRRRVFLSRGNVPYKRPELTNKGKQWALWLVKAGLTHRPAYQLRHTYASRLLMMKDVKATWLAEQMGHADTSMIFKIYARWIKKDNLMLMKNIATALGQKY